MTEFDDLIADSLHGHAAHIEVAPAGFEEVRRRARLRRSRHLALAVSPVLVTAAYVSGASRSARVDVGPASGDGVSLDIVTPTTTCPDTGGGIAVTPTSMATWIDPVTGDTITDAVALTVPSPTWIDPVTGGTVTETTAVSVATEASQQAEVLPTTTYVVTNGAGQDEPLLPTTTIELMPPDATNAVRQSGTSTTIAPAPDGPLSVETATGAIAAIDPCSADGEQLATAMGCRIDTAQLALALGSEFAAECDDGLTAWCTVVGGDGLPNSIDCTSVTVPTLVDTPTTSTFEEEWPLTTTTTSQVAAP